MHDEAQVRLVEAHPQRGGSHQRLDPILLQGGLRLLPILRVRAAGVGQHLVPRLGEDAGGVLRGGDGQGVDDAAARQIPQVRQQPRDPGGVVRQAQHPQAQGIPGQGAAQGEHLLTHPQLLLDVRDHPAVGRGRGGQHRHPGRQGADQIPDAPVVRAEVVAPVGDAVGLIHHQQGAGAHQLRLPLLAEPGVVQPLRADQQHVQLSRAHPVLDLRPLGGVRGVHGGSAHPRPLGRGHLVPHQRQQRGDDQGRSPALLAQQQRGEEVHRGLAPPGALDHQGPGAVRHQRADRLELPRMEVSRRVAGQCPQGHQGPFAQGGVGIGLGGIEAGPGGVVGVHDPMVAPATDTAKPPPGSCGYGR
ncbi:Uncharacterised protein [Mycobacteroides abscessus subsp. abscessus]|nr:Uncharacterised protein [Mycobacteroides abscessus subsp. abscessus]